ncbi:MAG: glutamate 5-kinase [SAR202 cluster bacterium]|nr:glutamate 5-kinase [SAR202 cluster bacterium]OUU74056.1 MAG: glutamate 5-kinase [Chloroflexi bacterium TMED70]RZP16889.1 MAG: glutamate 5-kinase [Chloroflexota bacterium]|tara:strand:- start:1595 stop:2734 length:1140 start_codon:yes stop_codon:yes gene_type:complete
MATKNKLRIVIKIGSNLITENENILNYEVIKNLCNQIAAIQKDHNQVIVVSSGAVAAGSQYLSKFEKEININNNSIVQKQLLASIGQPILMNAYEKYFSQSSIMISQALLSREDFENRLGYLNIRNTLSELLSLNVVPIINENDVVSTEELIDRAYGDNDRLSAMVSNAIDADLLILLGTIDGLYTSDPNIDKKAKKIGIVENITDEIINYAQGSIDGIGSGGMASKIQAANISINSGTEMYIASGLENDVLKRIISGEIIGTKFLSKQSLNESRKRWLMTGYSSSKGDISLDDGAIKAIKNRSSILPPGIINTTGDFDRGDIIGIRNSNDKIIGWGISNYSSKEISKIKGINSSKIIEVVEKNYGSEVIHRNNLVLTL